MNEIDNTATEIDALERALGYRFKNRDLLWQALTHSSYNHEFPGFSQQDNERLEFLGDSVLDLGVAKILMAKFPSWREGRMSKLRSALVNDRHLAELARKLKLGDFLRLGRGEEISGGREKVSVLANTLEAVVAAVYLDGGHEQALQLIETLFLPFIETAESLPPNDVKSALQELSHTLFNAVPTYTLVDEYGPDHEKTYIVSISVGDRRLAEGRGRSKKDAERAAAASALKALAEGDAPPSLRDEIQASSPLPEALRREKSFGP